jgi:NDP-sugar pyrophosphorylase family protein
MAMSDSVAGLVLAAGDGVRLRPLTLERPKALCPVGGVPLVDRAIGILSPLVADIAVNVHAGADLMEAHLGSRVLVSREEELLGTGGAVSRLRPWIDGRALVMVNADTIHGGSLAPLLQGWEGQRIRFLAVGPAGTPFHPGLRLLAVGMPPAAVAQLTAEPGSIYAQVWRPWADRSMTEVTSVDVTWFDCGTPRSYLRAHQWLTGEQLCVWPGAEDRVRSWMTDAVVTPRRVVLVR